MKIDKIISNIPFQVKKFLPGEEVKTFVFCDKKDNKIRKAFLNDGWKISLPKKQFINNEDEYEYILLYKIRNYNKN